MYKLYLNTLLVFVLTWGIQNNALAQIFNGSLRLSTQADVDNFDYTQVNGALNIGPMSGDSDIRDLSPLSKLNVVGGSLVISGTLITNLDGLSNLRLVRSTFLIASNSELLNVDGLSWLEELDTRLEIRNNPKLQNIDGLANLKKINSLLRIRDCPQLDNLDGLHNLEEANFLNLELLNIPDLKGLSNLRKINTLTIQECHQLSNLQGLSQLDSVIVEFDIVSNDNLFNLEGLSKLSFIENLSLSKNPRLKNLAGMPTLQRINNGLVIFENDSLPNLEGLAIEELGLLYITENPLLESLDGLSSLKRVTEGITLGYYENDRNGEIIRPNPSLKNVDGLSNLESIGRYLVITESPELLNLDGLANLKEVESININVCLKLENINGLGNVEKLNRLYVFLNPSLKVCCVIPQLVALIPPSGEARVGTNGELCSSVATISENCENGISFQLLDAQQDQVVSSIQDGDTIHLLDFEDKIDILALPIESASFKSIRFELFDEAGNRIKAKLENFAPYVFGGNVQDDFQGIDIEPGVYRLKALAYARKNGVSWLQSSEVVFTIIDRSEVTTSLNIFPNSSSTFVQLRTQIGKQRNGLLRIFNLKGELMQEQAFQGTLDTKLALNTWPEGIYIGSLFVDGKLLETRRILIKK